MGTGDVASKNVMDGYYSDPVAGFIADLFSPIAGAPVPFQPVSGGTSPKPGNGQQGGNNPNQLGNGAGSNYGDGEAMPVPSAPPSKIWSGSSSLASGAGTSAKGTAPRASISLAKGEQVQKHLDQIAAARTPAGEVQKGQQIQKQMGNSSGKTSSNPSGPAAKLQKGEQIQKQIEAGASTSTTPSPNPPSPPSAGSTTMATLVPFPFWSAFGWGYFGNDYASGGDAGVPVASAVAPPDDPANPTDSRPADGELVLKLGQSYTIANENFGEKAGGMLLQLNGLTLRVHVDQWDESEISFTLPAAMVTKVTEAKFQIAGAGHQLLKAVTVMVVSADPVQ
jgi:hypothetical protein